MNEEEKNAEIRRLENEIENLDVQINELKFDKGMLQFKIKKLKREEK